MNVRGLISGRSALQRPFVKGLGMADKTWIELRCAWRECLRRFYGQRRSRRYCSDRCQKADSRAPAPRYSRRGKVVHLEALKYQSPTGRQRRPQTFKPVLAADGRMVFAPIEKAEC